jgi:hypothetical protein
MAEEAFREGLRGLLEKARASKNAINSVLNAGNGVFYFIRTF